MSSQGIHFAGQCAQSPVNRYFDQVYVINLARRPDRKLAMLQKLRRLGIRAEFVTSIDGTEEGPLRAFQRYAESPLGDHPLERLQQRKLITSPGAWGYLKTYYAVLLDADQRGYQRILCLDDDLLFDREFTARFEVFTNRVPEDWVLLYLGASQFVWRIPDALQYPDRAKIAYDPDEPFYHPARTDGSFAMGIHRRCFKQLFSEIGRMDAPLDSGPLRSVIRSYPDKCFVATPNLVIADVGDSDLRGGQDQQAYANQVKWDLNRYDCPFEHDLISVVMPAYNAAKTIVAALESSLADEYPRIEVVVVDDGSDDGTAAAVESVARRDQRVRLVRGGWNRGVGAARNLGIRVAQGSLIAYLDADDIALPGRLTRQLLPIYQDDVDCCLATIHRGCCTSDELMVVDPGNRLAHARQAARNRRHVDQRAAGREVMAFGSAVIRRSLFETLGLYRNLRFAEDMEFFERLLVVRTGRYFADSECAHAYLGSVDDIPNTLRRIDDVLLIGSQRTATNLTSLYDCQRDERVTLREKYRQVLRNESGCKGPPLEPLPAAGFSPMCRLRYPEWSAIDLDTRSDPKAAYIDDHTKRSEHAKDFAHSLRLSDEVERLRAELSCLESSLSWRITRPLRWLANTVGITREWKRRMR